MYKHFFKRPVRSFRDLEVYQGAMSCSVIIAKNIKPKLARLKYELLENMINCSLSVPLWIGEAHSQRFSDFRLAILTLEKAMAGCNKMIIYLEQVLGIYGQKLPTDLIEDLMKRYIELRGKMFRLEKSWQKFRVPVPRLPRC
jgi:hypothetical protein